MRVIRLSGKWYKYYFSFGYGFRIVEISEQQALKLLAKKDK